MALEPQKERIDDLERDLYSREAPEITAKQRPELSKHEKMVQYGWKEEDTLASQAEEIQQAEKHSLITKIFMASVLFFVVAAGIAAYVILGGFNVISSKNVDISVRSLISVAAGEELSLDVIVKNNNNTALTSGNINIEYPDGARMAGDVTKELHRDQIPFDTVAAGGSVTKTVKAVLFGQKDSVQQIKITVDYKAKGSNATFSKEKTYEITIKSSPVLMSANVPTEINSGQDVTITIDLASNSNTIVRDLLVRAEYPFGFTYLSATPDATFEKNVWNIGDFNPKDKRTIVIHGRMDGQNEEERTFRFMTGTASPTDEKELAVNYIMLQQPITIKKPFIDLSLELGGKVGDYVVASGDKVQAVLKWSNNLPITINDAQIEVKLSGIGFDRTQVFPGVGGFFRSSDNTIIWDKNSLRDLQSIDPGEGGLITFSFGSLPPSQQILSQGRNMNIALTATAKGTRIQGGVPQEIQSTASGLVKVGTSLAIAGKTLHNSGPISNTGPVPPRVDQKTTYTVVWDISNAFNDVADVVVTTTLPPYVRWTGSISPTNEQLGYNPSTRTVTWSVADLRAGVGFVGAPREAAFQIELEPSVNQMGSAPDLTTALNITGKDRFTGTTVQAIQSPLNTRTADSNFRSGDERVN